MDRLLKVIFDGPATILLTLLLLGAIVAILFTDIFAFV